MLLRPCALLVLSAVAACGASPRLVQQSATYYEHCQAAEMNPERTVDERRECWVAWLEHYTIGQPLERISYAQERRIALAHGDEIDPLPDRVDPGFELRSSQEVAEETRVAESDSDETRLAPAIAESDSDAAGNAAPEAQAIADPPVFRQDEGAPPGRHFPVRTVPPPDDAPIPGPPGIVDDPCGTVCNPAWYSCADRCNGRAGGCMNACLSQHRQCMGACNGNVH